MAGHAPTCPRCGTDKFLEILEYRPFRTEPLQFGTSQGKITRMRDVEPEAQYECRACRYFNGHTVPREWEPPKG